MPSFSDSIFLFVLALLLFGPKKLPVLARELGKWIGEFRRASNEFKMQMEEELRASEQAERQKQIASMEAAAPVTPSLDSEPEHPHLPSSTYPEPTDTETLYADAYGLSGENVAASPESTSEALSGPDEADTVHEPLPIASSGSLHIMPPSTGLPTPRVRDQNTSDPLGDLMESIPAAPDRKTRHNEPQETAANA